MAFEVPRVLVMGHSFVKRLNRDINTSCLPRAGPDFNLQGTASVRLYGVGGRTVAKLRAFDLHVIRSFSPDVVILELGTNDLASLRPEVVGSAIEDLVRFILDSFSVRVVGVCQVIPRGISHLQATFFAQRARILNQYLEVVLDPLPDVFCWRHRAFSHPSKDVYLPDGVHLNPAGQYQLYRSYRGAILRAVSLL